VFTYETDQHSSLSCLKVKQVDGTLKATTVTGTAVNTDGAEKVTQAVQVLNFEMGWVIEVFSGWSGFSAKDWKFYIGNQTFKRGLFVKKNSVSGPKLLSLPVPLCAAYLGAGSFLRPARKSSCLHDVLGTT